MGRTLASVTGGLALCLLLTSCGGGDGEEPRVTAARQCDDTLSPQAAAALESVLGAEEFQSVRSGGLQQSVRDLIGDQEKLDSWESHPSMCRIAPVEGKTDLAVEFNLYSGDADLYAGAKLPARRFYGMGRETSSDNKTAYLFLECSSPRLKGSGEVPARIKGMLRAHASREESLPSNTAATREAYVAILHSVSLAVVRELGCENDAGLPEKPVLTERT
ncbi:hypothetical protein PV371_05595 [Streptomyces sp. TX20-6-3]|uniref:hypothetical protein n=1 Tax=Streptomyces sp. TX20-6-3 TaxID=3028705 RepID=UPI0029A9390A|nr:hypothetical protein [Streptomyces sp. TX20-6-3]MDX2559120.1 hypothetical protein [Streptomyces sp. TX20-6-3]